MAAERRTNHDGVHEVAQPDTVTLSAVELTDVVYLSPSMQVTGQNIFQETSTLSGEIVHVLHTAGNSAAPQFLDPAAPAVFSTTPLFALHSTKTGQQDDVGNTSRPDPSSGTTAINDNSTILKISSSKPVNPNGFDSDGEITSQGTPNQPTRFSNASDTVQDEGSEIVSLQSSVYNTQQSDHTAHAVLSANPAYLTNQEYISALSPYLYKWQSSDKEPASSTPQTEQNDQISVAEPEKASLSSVQSEFVLLKDTANVNTPVATVASAPATVSGTSTAATDNVINSGSVSSLLSQDNQVGISGSYATRLGSIAGGLLGLGGLGAAGLSGVDLGSVVSSATGLIRNVLPISKRRDDKPLPVPYRVRRPHASRPYLRPVHRLREQNQNSRRDSYSPNNGYLAVRGPQGQMIGPLAEKNYFHNPRLRHAQRKTHSHRIILPLRPPEISLQIPSKSHHFHQNTPSDRPAMRKKDHGVPNGFIAIVPPSRLGPNFHSTPVNSNFRGHTHVPNTKLFLPPPPRNDFNAFANQENDEISDNVLYEVIERNEEFSRPTTEEGLNQLPQNGNAADDDDYDERSTEKYVNKFSNQDLLTKDTILNTDNSLTDAFYNEYSGSDQAYAASIADFQQKHPTGSDVLQRAPLSAADFESSFDNNHREQSFPVLVSTLHTIASVEGLNRIVGTNVFASVVPLVTAPAIISFRNSAPPSVTRPTSDFHFSKHTETSFQGGSVEASVRKIGTTKSVTPLNTSTGKVSTNVVLKKDTSKSVLDTPIEIIPTDLSRLPNTQIKSKIVTTKSINKNKNSPIATVLTDDDKVLDRNIENKFNDFPKINHKVTTNIPDLFRSSLSLESSIEEITENTPWYFQVASTDPYEEHVDSRDEYSVAANAPSATEFSISGIATPELKFKFEKSTKHSVKKLSTKSVRKSLNRIRTRLADRIRLTLRTSQKNGVSIRPQKNVVTIRPQKNGVSIRPQRNGDSMSPSRKGISVPPRKNGVSVPPQINAVSVPPRRNSYSVLPQSNDDSIPSEKNSEETPQQKIDSKYTIVKNTWENHSNLQRIATKPRFRPPWRRTTESINISDLSKILLATVQRKRKSSVEPSIAITRKETITGVNDGHRTSSSYILSVTRGSFTTILGPDAKTLPSNTRTTESIDSSTLIHGTSTLYDGDFTEPTLPLLNIHDITEISNGVDSPQTNYITRTEYFTRTITATKTEIQKSGTSITTKTILITSTLKPITVISTIIGMSTNIVTLNTATPTRVVQLVKTTQPDIAKQVNDKQFDLDSQLTSTSSVHIPNDVSPPTTVKYIQLVKNIQAKDNDKRTGSTTTIRTTTENIQKTNKNVDRLTEESTQNRIVLSAGVVPRLSAGDTISLGEKIHQDVHEDNEVNRVVINPGVNRQVVIDRPAVVTHSCPQPCLVSAHEVCRRKHGVYRCACKPGFARVNGSESCQGVYTYKLKILLERVRDLPLTFRRHFEDENSSEHKTLTLLTRSGVKKSLASSPLAEKVKNVELLGYEHVRSQGEKFRHLKTGVLADLVVQLDREENEAGDNKENLRESILRSIARRNFSLGDKDLIVSRHTEAISTEDFDECYSADYNDCHDYAYCYNLDGGFTCSCRDGMVDSGPQNAPGRICSSATVGCETCNYHGECVSSNSSSFRSSDRGSGATERGSGILTCQCHRWYAGARCQINLRVLLIVGMVAGVVLVAILCCCCYLCCRGNGSAGGSRPAPPLVFTGADGFMRHRGSSLQPGLERRAMLDSSSDTTVTSHPSLIPSSLVGLKGISSHSSVTGDTSHDEGSRWVRRHGPTSSGRTAEASSTYQEERSVGSVGVVDIANMGGADVPMGGANAIPIARLIPRAKRSQFHRYPRGLPHSGSMRSHPNAEKIQRQLLSRICATPGVGTFTCRSRNSRSSSDDRGCSGSGFTDPVCLHPNGRSRSSDGGALRQRQRAWSSSQSSVNGHGSRTLEAGSTASGRLLCEARSFDETTVRPSVCSAVSERRSVRTAASSRTGFTDDHHTMAERDAASTFVMPETQLFRPVMDFDNQSDVSLMDDFPHLPYSYSRTPSTHSAYQR